VIGLGLAAVAVGVFLVGRKLGLLPGGGSGDAQDTFGASLSVRQNSWAMVLCAGSSGSAPPPASAP